jgi:hypothetical protein
MASITTRQTGTTGVDGVTRKDLPLTNDEIDANFISLNSSKSEQTGTTNSLIVPAGDTASRDTSPLVGYFRYNNQTNEFEGYSSTGWGTIGGDAGANITNDTSTNTTQYLGMSRSTTGLWTDAYTASTKLYFNPQSGALSSTTFNSLSDITFKENIKTISNATDAIKKLDGVEFDWKESGKHSYGVIAQKLEEILPELVETNEEGIKTVNYAGLTGFLINAIKEMDTRIKELENK